MLKLNFETVGEIQKIPSKYLQLNELVDQRENLLKRLLLLIQTDCSVILVNNPNRLFKPF